LIVHDCVKGFVEQPLQSAPAVPLQSAAHASPNKHIRMSREMSGISDKKCGMECARPFALRI
jgi:hypothetical protein